MVLAGWSTSCTVAAIRQATQSAVSNTSCTDTYTPRYQTGHAVCRVKHQRYRHTHHAIRQATQSAVSNTSCTDTYTQRYQTGHAVCRVKHQLYRHIHTTLSDRPRSLPCQTPAVQTHIHNAIRQAMQYRHTAMISVTLRSLPCQTPAVHTHKQHCQTRHAVRRVKHQLY